MEWNTPPLLTSSENAHRHIICSMHLASTPLLLMQKPRRRRRIRIEAQLFCSLHCKPWFCYVKWLIWHFSLLGSHISLYGLHRHSQAVSPSLFACNDDETWECPSEKEMHQPDNDTPFADVKEWQKHRAYQVQVKIESFLWRPPFTNSLFFSSPLTPRG